MQTILQNMHYRDHHIAGNHLTKYNTTLQYTLTLSQQSQLQPEELEGTSLTFSYSNTHMI